MLTGFFLFYMVIMNLFYKIFFLTLIALLVIYYLLKRQEEIPKATEEPASKKVDTTMGMTLFLCGDVMTGRGIDQAFPDAVDPKIYEPYIKDAKGYLRLAEEENGNIPEPISYEYIWGEAFDFWKQFQPRLRIINLETSITDHDEPWPRKGINYRMHPNNARTLQSAEIDFCALANNHTLDWKVPGLTETLVSLEDAKIKYAGAGRDSQSALQPAEFQTEEGRVLIFSYGHHGSGIPSSWEATDEEGGINFLYDLDADKVHEEIKRYKKPNDIVVLSIHWGGNWGYAIPGEQIRFAHALIDKGTVDLIHGHSSHHPKGIEVYKDKLIIYGAGDFINDYEGISGHEEFRGELSLMYFPELNGVGDLLSLTMVPMEIRKFQLHHASSSDVKWMQKRLDRECGQFGGKVELEEGVLRLGWE
jgi:poly-gamma-glutamate synthesis protein (capsule biosynthesis protein)